MSDPIHGRYPRTTMAPAGVPLGTVRRNPVTNRLLRGEQNQYGEPMGSSDPDQLRRAEFSRNFLANRSVTPPPAEVGERTGQPLPTPVGAPVAGAVSAPKATNDGTPPVFRGNAPAVMMPREDGTLQRVEYQPTADQAMERRIPGWGQMTPDQRRGAIQSRGPVDPNVGTVTARESTPYAAPPSTAGAVEGLINPKLPDVHGPGGRYNDANVWTARPGVSSLPPGAVIGDENGVQLRRTAQPGNSVAASETSSVAPWTAEGRTPGTVMPSEASGYPPRSTASTPTPPTSAPSPSGYPSRDAIITGPSVDAENDAEAARRLRASRAAAIEG